MHGVVGDRHDKVAGDDREDKEVIVTTWGIDREGQ